jgi:hypothetical protein
MKRVWWVARIAVLVAASYCIFAPGGLHMLRNVRADGDGCTADSCARNSDNNCYCPNVVMDGPGCKGCFVPNNDSSCGTCSAGGGGGGGGVGGLQP